MSGWGTLDVRVEGRSMSGVVIASMSEVGLNFRMGALDALSCGVPPSGHRAESR